MQTILWLDGGIMLKTSDPYGDPVELTSDQAREIATGIIRLADLYDDE